MASLHLFTSKMKTLILVGPHGVGKTTIGRALSKEFSIPFDEELGKQLASVPSLRPEGISASSYQPAFDRVVTELEILRDRSAPRSAWRIVETWHPGNLAYAHARSPGVVPSILKRIREVTRFSEAVVLPLVASEHTLAQRQTLPEGPLFYSKIAQLSLYWAKRLELSILPEMNVDEAPAEELVWDIADTLHFSMRVGRWAFSTGESTSVPIPRNMPPQILTTKALLHPEVQS